jgi:hypothetical protein
MDYSFHHVQHRYRGTHFASWSQTRQSTENNNQIVVQEHKLDARGRWHFLQICLRVVNIWFWYLSLLIIFWNIATWIHHWNIGWTGLESLGEPACRRLVLKHVRVPTRLVCIHVATRKLPL